MRPEIPQYHEESETTQNDDYCQIVAFKPYFHRYDDANGHEH